MVIFISRFAYLSLLSLPLIFSTIILQSSKLVEKNKLASQHSLRVSVFYDNFLASTSESKTREYSNSNFVYFTSFSQKYNVFRERFLKNFYKSGRVSHTLSSDNNQIFFGDQTIYLGQALMVFSTEIAILKKNNQDITDQKRIINDLLDAYLELDKKAESLYSADIVDFFNGFFVRDDINGVNDSRVQKPSGEKFNKVTSDWQNPEDATPSGDQIFGLMYGLACVVKYADDRDLANKAVAISRNLFDYSKRTNFILCMPDKKTPTKRGSDMRWLATLLHGLNKEVTGDDSFSSCKIDLGPFKNLPLNGVGAFWANSNTHTILLDLIGKDLKDFIPKPLRDLVPSEPTKLNSFALHILLMAMATSDIMEHQAFEKVATKANHELSILWYCLAHKKTPLLINKDKIKGILDLCPESGPCSNLPAKTGWNQDNRWIRCTNIPKEESGSDNFNGLDWMLLNNFFELVYN